MKKSRGFTLIELMIVIVVIAILASIAIPSYRDSVIKGNRRAAQTVAMDIVNRQQQLFAANRRYATTAQLNYTLPPEVAPHYTFEINLTEGPPPGFTVNFNPTGGQARDGILSINSQGVRAPLDKWK